MKVLVSGATGLIGSALTPILGAQGHQAMPLKRSEPTAGEGAIRWDPAAGTIEAEKLEGFDGVVHLAGESIAAGRWNEERKQRIRDSRVKGTRLLAETLVNRRAKPKVLVCASAVGYYGDRGDEVLREDSPQGVGFLPEVCKEWEAACDPARQAGIRVVNLRFGVVLSPRGGALAKMLTPFRMGVGGKLGSGKQYLSWIALDDVPGVIGHALGNDALSGPVNAVSPRPVTNLEFTKTLGKVLWRPTILPMPAFAARLLFGEMADALLLASARAEPARLRESAYPFRFPELESALRHLLGRPS